MSASGAKEGISTDDTRTVAERGQEIQEQATEAFAQALSLEADELINGLEEGVESLTDAMKDVLKEATAPSTDPESLTEYGKATATALLSGLAKIVLGEQYVEQIAKGTANGIQNAQGITPKQSTSNDRNTKNTGTV